MIVITFNDLINQAIEQEDFILYRDYLEANINDSEKICPYKDAYAYSSAAIQTFVYSCFPLKNQRDILIKSIPKIISREEYDPHVLSVLYNIEEYDKITMNIGLFYIIKDIIGYPYNDIFLTNIIISYYVWMNNENNLKCF